MLYGDALLRSGEYERAKNIFINLRKGAAGDAKTAMTKKITSCNKALKLDDNDGIRELTIEPASRRRAGPPTTASSSRGAGDR